ncbi:hypothetical protein QBC33DRAFT_32369 [Phialemonium atrogriseum]|uniref:Secreted protein n=1 Tax=Phialemonium atrogriseum TaxID=1093897 RepID=A0AAJ0CEL0_9PEZI|nr:uncharacterized protein QBC33DRAFT_32369 [Phialemonium atrogriseum]KAK1772881.1 hypothetical protein QBC33DRAFT_32369 [Phialemonium atrogriseum]
MGFFCFCFLLVVAPVWMIVVVVDVGAGVDGVESRFVDDITDRRNIFFPEWCQRCGSAPVGQGTGEPLGKKAAEERAAPDRPAIVDLCWGANCASGRHSRNVRSRRSRPSRPMAAFAIMSCTSQSHLCR